MRSLVLTRNVPFPPQGGGAMRVCQIIDHLADLGEVAVLCVAPGDEVTLAPPRVRQWRHVGDAWQAMAGSSTFARVRSSRWLLSRDGHRDADALCTAGSVRALREMLRQSPPDLIVVEELWLYPFLREVDGWTGATIYDAHNVEGRLRSSLEATSRSLVDRLKQGVLDRRVRTAERLLCRAVDAVWVCSEADAEEVRDQYGGDVTVDVIPNALDFATYGESPNTKTDIALSDDRRHLTIMFPAAFGYAPNDSAVDLLLRQIFPGLRAHRPDARVLLVGRSPTPAMRKAAASDPAIEVTGEVPDVRPYFARTDIVIVPLLQGSGTRLKILEAFAMRVPVVSTSKGAEGLHVEHGTHLLIADTPHGLIQALLRLADDQPLVSRLTNAAHHLVETEYSWTATAPRVAASIRRIGLPTRPK